MSNFDLKESDRMYRGEFLIRRRLTSTRLILLAGVTLVVGGAVCLYLSDAVAGANSWSQNTLDAFGVGLVVGGIVDVTAISLLNQILTGTSGQYSRRQRRNAEGLLGECEIILNNLEATGALPPISDAQATTMFDNVAALKPDAVDPLLAGRLLQLQDRLRAANYSDRLSAAMPRNQGE